MAISRPEAIDAALSNEPERSAGWRTGGYFVSRCKGARAGGK
jgi:hypothetical protein